MLFGIKMLHRYLYCCLFIACASSCASKDYSFINDRMGADQLITILQNDKDYRARKYAAQVLGEIGAVQAETPLMVAALDDGNSAVRYKSAEALNQMGSKGAGEYFTAHLKNTHSRTFYRAAQALYRCGDKAPLLIIKLKDRKRRTRLDAAYELIEVADPRSVDSLIEVLATQEVGLVGYAARALGKIKDPHAVDPLLVILQEQYFDVEETAWALGEIGDSRALEPLITVLTKGTLYLRKYDQEHYLRGRTRDAVIEALGKLKDRRALPCLLDNLNVNPNDKVIDAIIKINDPTIVAKLVDVIDREKDVYQACGAAKILIKIKDKIGLHYLKTLLYQGRPKIVAAIYPFYVHAGLAGSEEIMINALNTHGSKAMAQFFINYGNDLLRKAGYDWAQDHGYKIRKSFGWGGQQINKWGTGW